MTQLRNRMIEDMRIRNFSPRTIDRYVACVASFARHFERCPSTLGPTEIREFQVHLAVTRKLSFTTLNQTVCALRFLYRTTLGNEFPIELIPYARREKKLPVVLSREEIASLLDVPCAPKHHAIIATFYATGIRLRELQMLPTSALDADRGTICIEGKGARHRLVPLSARLLGVLRSYWRESGIESPWLFPGQDPSRPLCRETIQRAVSQAARRAGIKKRVSPHTLRHTFATHLLEAGNDLVRIQRILGHAKLTTSAIYFHVASEFLHSVKNPFDLLVDLSGDLDMEAQTP